jgi:hypothetical protein
MKFSAVFAAFATFASYVSAQSNPITSPTGGALQAGVATTITWQPSDSGTITLKLRSGSSNALTTIGTIASNIENKGTYTWTPDASLPSGADYTIEITSSANPTSPNYSPRFAVTGGGAASSGVPTSGSSASGTISKSASLPTVSASGNGTVTTTASSANSTEASNSTTTSKTSSTKASSSKTSSTASSTSSGGASAPSSAASMIKGSDCGLLAAIFGLAGLVAMI